MHHKQLLAGRYPRTGWLMMRMMMVLRKGEAGGALSGGKLPDGGLVEGPWQTGGVGRRGPARRLKQ